MSQKKDERGRQRSIGIATGPEGGFTDEEVRNALQAGFIPVTMGPRVLRMETAAVVVVSLVLYELGEMGNYSSGGGAAGP